MCRSWLTALAALRVLAKLFPRPSPWILFSEVSFVLPSGSGVSPYYHTATQEGSWGVPKAADEIEEITDLVMTHVEPTPETLPNSGELLNPRRDIVLVPVPG